MGKLKFYFKIGCPTKAEICNWGDYYLADSLGKYLKRLGHSYKIHILPEWDLQDNADIVIHLRGLSEYNIKANQFNIMWNISHPEKISLKEYEKYDLVLVSSYNYANILREKIKTPVITFLQFTDNELFNADYDESLTEQILFVGNSRGVMRDVIKYILPPPKELSIYGNGWEELIDKKYIKEKWFPNDKLRKLYSSCDILLNDHWEDMRKYGFINNRVFDALACKSIILNDKFDELLNVFPNIPTYTCRNDLLELINDININKNRYVELANKLYDEVLEKHTAKTRAKDLLDILKEYEIEIMNKKNNKILNQSKVQLKDRVKLLIINTFGYGKIYRIIQKQWQRFKNVKENGLTKEKKKIIRKILPNYRLNNSVNYCSEIDIKSLARKLNHVSISEYKDKVSIIIPNKNGYKYLKKLIPSILENTIHDNYEITIVDNKSSDNSVHYINSFNIENIKIINTDSNLNFSQSINFGVNHSQGELLIFLNNDIEVLYGWLTRLINTLKRNENCGIVGARLVYTELNHNKKGEVLFPGCSVQHDGIKFEMQKNKIKPVNIGKFRNPLDLNNIISEEQVPAVTAACMLTTRESFNKVNGFDESYNFGKEDVDFCLKVREMLNKDIYMNRKSLLFHKEFSTQIKNSRNKRKKWRINNDNIFQNKWNDQLKKVIWKEKLENKDLFWSTEKLKITFLVTEFNYNATAGDMFSALGLGQALSQEFGYEVTYLTRRPEFEWNNISNDTDIVITMMHDFDIRKLHNSDSFINIAWIRGHIDEWIEKSWINDFDGIITTSEYAMKKVQEIVHESKCWGSVPLGANTSVFDCERYSYLQRDIDVCFVGNIFDVPRDIVKNLEIDQNVNFHFYGRLEAGSNHPWHKYHRGMIPYKDLPEIYARSKIVIEDIAPFNKGTVNLRIYEAAALRALVITNEFTDIEKIFGDSVVRYKDKCDLGKKINHYLSNEFLRKDKAEKAKEIVLSNHTFNNRAKQYQSILVNAIFEENRI